MLYLLYLHDQHTIIKTNSRFNTCGKNKLIISRRISLCLNVPMACTGCKRILYSLLLEFRISLENTKYKKHETRSWKIPVLTNIVFG